MIFTWVFYHGCCRLHERTTGAKLSAGRNNFAPFTARRDLEAEVQIGFVEFLFSPLVFCHYPIRRRGQIVHDYCAAKLVTCTAFEFDAVARPYQQTLFHSRVPAALQISQFVSDHVAVAQIQAELLPGVKKKLR